MTSQQYAWKSGAIRFRKLNPQTIGEELQRLAGEATDRLTADFVVETAKDPASPLHRAFPWSDAKAAHAHRLDLARKMLHSITVRIVTTKNKEVVTRAFVTTERAGSHGGLAAKNYTTTEYAMRDPELRAQVLRQALRDFAALKRRYIELSELSELFSVVDSFIAQHHVQ